VRKAQSDVPEAWRALVRLYGPLVDYWCTRAGLQPQDRADVTQEVFLSVARGLEDFRKDTNHGSFRGWLLVITRRKVCDFLRRQQKLPATTVDPAVCETILSQQELRPASEGTKALFRRALAIVQNRFEERTWQAFYGVAVEGRPAAEVARALEMRPSAVYNARSRVLRRLRDELGDFLT
jgi:RNA polymerase sigma-70 factor (ECF subfamily)